MNSAADTNFDSTTPAQLPLTLVLLAAGIGRRFGGLKQLEGVGPNGETILEYTAYDAMRAGVKRVTLVVRPETEAEFRQTVGRRLERCVDVAYVHQTLDNTHRTKPWGTAHAVLCAAEVIDGPFIVANADDFYGAGAVAAGVDHFKQGVGADSCEHALIGFRLRDTLPKTGRVSRAVCTCDGDVLSDLVEMMEAWREGDHIVALDAAGRRHSLSGDELVSMNLWAFRPELLPPLRLAFDQFLSEHGASADAEFQLPVVIRDLVRTQQACVRVVLWTGPWCGVTNREDLDAIRKHIDALTCAEKYPRHIGDHGLREPSDNLRSIVAQFGTDGDVISIAPLPGGHIHNSHVISVDAAEGTRRYVLQRINTNIFTDPDGLMENVVWVTEHLRNRLLESNPIDRDRRVLTFVSTRTGGVLHRPSDGSCWRMCRFIERSTAIEFPRSPADAGRAGRAYGELHTLLADLPPPALNETILHFHDTPHRLAALEQAIAADTRQRVDAARTEIEYALSQRPLAGVLIEPLRQGELPSRIAHNDAKLSNVLLDVDFGVPLCVVDLDTVMPGTVLFDFGDMMRTMICPATEDERDLSKVRVDLDMFAGLAHGYLAATRGFLTQEERDVLVTAGLVITYEQGIRFLSDYLLGDSYYRTTRPDQNLDRCRVQFTLLRQLEESYSKFESIIEKEWRVR